MKTLVLCVDRDNDLGEKTGLKGPIVGREEVLNAAVALGLKDPEDSDTNSLFSAVSMYDELVKDDVETEVAAILGDVHVGYKSDRILVSQLENVLTSVKPDRTVLISDGAEDEHIYPIVSSRVKVDSVRRVFVRQSKDIQSFYYMIARGLQDEKIRNKFYVPIAVAFIVYAIWALTGYTNVGRALIAFTIGLYLVIKAKGLEQSVLNIYAGVKHALVTGSVILLSFTFIGVILVIAGLVNGIDVWMASEDTPLAHRTLLFIGAVLWWCVFGIWMHIVGRVLDAYVRRRDIEWSFWIITFSLMALGLIIYAALDFIKLLLGFEDAVAVKLIIVNFFFGGFIALMGGLVHRYIKENVTPETTEEWRQ